MLQIIVFRDRWLVIRATDLVGPHTLACEVLGTFDTLNDAEAFIDRGGQ
jgi:hypothetical protein